MTPTTLNSANLREVVPECIVEVMDEDYTNPNLENPMDDGMEDDLPQSFYASPRLFREDVDSAALDQQPLASGSMTGAASCTSNKLVTMMRGLSDPHPPGGSQEVHHLDLPLRPGNNSSSTGILAFRSKSNCKM